MIRTDSGLILPHPLFSCNPLFLGNFEQITDLWLQPSLPLSSQFSLLFSGSFNPSSQYGCPVKQKPSYVPRNEMKKGWDRCIIPSTLYRNGINRKDCYATEMVFVALKYRVYYCSSVTWCQHLKSPQWFSDGYVFLGGGFLGNQVINIRIFELEVPDGFCLGHIYNAVIAANATNHNKHGLLPENIVLSWVCFNPL